MVAVTPKCVDAIAGAAEFEGRESIRYIGDTLPLVGRRQGKGSNDRVGYHHGRVTGSGAYDDGVGG